MANAFLMRIGLFIGVFSSALFCNLPDLRADDLTIELREAQLVSHYAYMPMKLKASQKTKNFYISREEFITIQEVSGLRIYYESWGDRYGFYVSYTDEGVGRIETLINNNPDSLLALVINDRLSMVTPVKDSLEHNRIKTEAVFTRGEAFDVLKAYLELSQRAKNIRFVIVSITATIAFITCLMVGLIGTIVYKHRVLKRRKKYFEEFQEEIRTKKLTRTWRSPF